MHSPNQLIVITSSGMPRHKDALSWTTLLFSLEQFSVSARFLAASAASWSDRACLLLRAEVIAVFYPSRWNEVLVFEVFVFLSNDGSGYGTF